MSLGIAIVAPEGLVLAAESRLTLSGNNPAGQMIHVSYDNATKVLSFNEPHQWVGAVTYGQAVIGVRTAASFLPEFETGLGTKRLKVQNFAQAMSDFYMAQWKAVPMQDPWPGSPLMFLVGGYDDKEPYPCMYEFALPNAPTPLRRQAPGDFGMVWGGQREHVDRLVQGFDAQLPDLIQTTLGLTPAQRTQLDTTLAGLQLPLPLQAMPLQDCIDLAIFFIRTTIAAQSLTVGIRGVGGPIDIATVTRRDGLAFVQQKTLHGE